MGENPPADGKFFFSVERFDYTKGIKEKLIAYRRYFQKYPDRIGKDVLYQVCFVLILLVQIIKDKRVKCSVLINPIREMRHVFEFIGES